MFHFLDDLGWCFGIVIALAVYILFLSAVVRVLVRVEPENRRMEPGQVWLNLLPLFNVLWLVVTVERVGESVRNEMAARGRRRRGEGYGKTTGLTWLALTAVGLAAADEYKPLAMLAWLVALIYWVVYWAQLAAYASRLRDEGAAYTPPVDEGW